MKRKWLGVGVVLLCLIMSTILTTANPLFENSISMIDPVKETYCETNTDLRGVNITLEGTIGENGWYISPVRVVIVTDNGTQIVDILYSINGGAWQHYTVPFIITTNGWFFLKINVLDQYGIWWFFCFNFGIDLTPPTIELNKETLLINRIKFIANATDCGSGVWRVEFFLNDTRMCTDNEFPFEWIWKGTGAHTVTAKVFDRAGHIANSSMNVSAVHSFNQNKLGIQRMHHFVPYMLLHQQKSHNSITYLLEKNR